MMKLKVKTFAKFNSYLLDIAGMFHSMTEINELYYIFQVIKFEKKRFQKFLTPGVPVG